jgi:hypothetical protein
MVECREAIALYDHLDRTTIYRPEFSLRFVWIAAVSAFDHYISQIILEKATAVFASSDTLTPKLMSDVISFSNAFELRRANAVDAIIIFRSILSNCIKYKSFQHPDKVSDGLSYIWAEKHKWQFIATQMGSTTDQVKAKLENIVDRRNSIAHNADYDEARQGKIPINVNDTREVVQFVGGIVEILDAEIFS